MKGIIAMYTHSAKQEEKKTLEDVLLIMKTRTLWFVFSDITPQVDHAWTI